VILLDENIAKAKRLKLEERRMGVRQAGLDFAFKGLKDN
jgi:hypothetical protein